MDNLPDPDLVVFKNVLHKNKTENDIMNIIRKKVSLLNDDLKKYKFDAEFLLYICNLVEHLVGSNKFDKKKLVLNIVSSIFNLNLNETEVISNLVEFLHSNNLIKKVEKKADDFFLYKLNAIFQKKTFRIIGKKCLNALKYASTNIIKDYAVNEVIIPFLNMKLGITSKIIVLVILGFL
jgi:DNA primase catalytic subunit